MLSQRKAQGPGGGVYHRRCRGQPKVGISSEEQKKLLVALLASLVLTLLVGCGSQSARTSEAPDVVGITPTEIRLGASCALTGHASLLGTQTISGALAYLHHINEQGGVHGRQLKLLVYDDGYDPDRCVANTQKLINEDKVFALTCYVGTPTAVKIIPMVEEGRVPLVGLFTGASPLREPFRRYIINIRASYYQETGAAVQHLVEDLGIRKFAVFYQYDAYGFDGLTGTELALAPYNLKPVAKASYLRGSLDVEAAVAQITSSDAEAVIMIGTYGPCAKFIKLAKEQKAGLIFHNVSFVGPGELVKLLGPDAEGVIITQVVPPPWERALLPAAEEYNRLLARHFPDEPPSFVGFEGFVNAMVLVEGLKRAGRDLNRERLIESIESIQQFSIGIANTLNFSPTDHQGLEHVYFTQVRDGNLVLVTNWERLKKERSVPGVTATEVVLGSSCALTGHASFLGSQTIDGALAYIKHVNERGGVNGRRLKLIVYDDGYDPDRCVANTRRLINEDSVFALTCYVGTPTAVRIIPAVEEAHIPLVGVFSGATALREPFRRFIINIRASYYQEIEKVVDHLVKESKFTKIAVFYQEDAYGEDGLAGTTRALRRHRLKPVATGSYQRGTMEVEPALREILAAQPEAVVMIGTYGPCARFIKLAKARNCCAVFHNVSFVGAEELVKLLGPDAERVIVTQVVPPPWETALLPAAEEYTRLLARYFPQDTPNFVGFEGFVNAKVVVQALRRLGREVTREKFIEAIEHMEFYSPGIGANINFSETDHQGLDQVYLTGVRNGRLVLFTDWSEVRSHRAAGSPPDRRAPEP
ncbi:MAG: ABC transporter substrate-binding protein [Nitrospirota bacterium]